MEMSEMVHWMLLVSAVTFAIGISMVVFSLLEQKALQQMMEKAMEVINEAMGAMMRWEEGNEKGEHKR